MPVSCIANTDVGRAAGAALEALGRVAPTASERAARALDTILAAWQEHGDGPHLGRLTAGGFPVEIVCTSRDAAARYTCDVAGPAVPPDRRLRAGEALVRRLHAEVSFPLPHLQEGGAPLRWGAWLGGRHTATADAYKLYAEAPAMLSDGAVVELREALGGYALLLDSHAVGLRLVGWEPSSGRLEFYFRGHSLQPAQVGRLMHFAGLGDRQAELRALLDDAVAAPLWERLPGTRHGFSIAMASGSTADAFSFFTFARSLFGDDAMVRRGLLALADRQGWNMDAYAAVSAPLAARHDADVHHGIVSWMVPQAGPLGIGVGVRPALVDR